MREKKVVEKEDKPLRKDDICKVCKIPIKNHPVCPTCGCLCGSGHLDFLTNFRNHQICHWCADKWQWLEKRYKTQIPWAIFATWGGTNKAWQNIIAEYEKRKINERISQSHEPVIASNRKK